jgi:hypothetical protein
MTLFETESQYRERETIWRVFSLLPLYASLAGGRVWRWFAINTPMDLGTGGAFTSDIDIIARLNDFPRSKEWLYKTWEVKVGLLFKDGTGRSLKIGKIRRTKTQLNAYKEFGSPHVSLLDIYIREAGFLEANTFPPPVLHETISSKLDEMRQDGFGYQLLSRTHEPSFNQSLLRALCLLGIFSPSRRQMRCTRSFPTCQPAVRNSAVILR